MNRKESLELLGEVHLEPSIAVEHWGSRSTGPGYDENDYVIRCRHRANREKFVIDDPTTWRNVVAEVGKKPGTPEEYYQPKYGRAAGFAALAGSLLGVGLGVYVVMPQAPEGERIGLSIFMATLGWMGTPLLFFVVFGALWLGHHLFKNAPDDFYFPLKTFLVIFGMAFGGCWGLLNLLS